ncbi:MAG: hypothetical protein V4507_06375 [Verrucomicrobiota bacterium]
MNSIKKSMILLGLSSLLASAQVVLLTDNFNAGTGTTSTSGAAIGTTGWKNFTGSEAKEYNVASSGDLEIRNQISDVATDSVSHDFSATSLVSVGDSISVSFKFQVFGDTAGSINNTNAGFRVQFVDSTQVANSGYGINIASGTNTSNNFIKGTSTIPSGALTYNVDETVFTDVVFTLTKVSTGIQLSGSIGGTSFSNANNPIDSTYSTFDRLVFSVAALEQGGRIDDVTVTSIPEPSTKGMLVGLGFGFGFLTFLQRRSNLRARSIL